MIEKIAVLISGGVDSAVVVHLLCEQGYRPDLFYIKIGNNGDDSLTCTAEEDLEFCHLIARRYGLKLEVVDLQRQYWNKVMTYVVEKVRLGLTPNPDVMCNKLIKFGCFNDEAGHLYDTIATGHYARTLLINGQKWLATTHDIVKDQTDFLAQIDSLQLKKLIFPLGDLTKEEVRRVATEAQLPNARRRDSQGICFLGKINYNDLLRRFLDEREGDVIEWGTGRKVGTHHGYWFHTIGQRKGLGLGGGPWFVIKKDIGTNTIFVSHGEADKQYGTEFYLRDFHFITDDYWRGQTEPIDLTFKIRHTVAAIHGTMSREGNLLHITSEKPLQGIAPGQFGVLYDKDWNICVGSGEITIPDTTNT